MMQDKAAEVDGLRDVLLGELGTLGKHTLTYTLCLFMRQVHSSPFMFESIYITCLSISLSRDDNLRRSL